MQCSVESLVYNYKTPEQVRQLNLQSSTNRKIHTITHLDNFIRLRVLILSNNLITKMSGLQNLRSLRVLNLQFNQLKVVEGTSNLKNLQQLYLSYNEIQIITDQILSNRKLRILHLAYNDITNLENISILYKSKEQQQKESNQQTFNKPLQQSRYVLSQLTTFSIYGNPIVQTINYLSFFKMLIPSLRIIDDKNVDDQIIMGNVCPQQEVIILREAINKLLDQRNSAVQQLENYVTTPRTKLKDNKKQEKGQKIQEKVNGQVSTILQQKKRVIISNKQLVKYLEGTRDKYVKQLQIGKQKITQLSKKYAQNIRRTKKSSIQPNQFHQYISIEGDVSQNTGKRQFLNQQQQIQDQSFSMSDRITLNKQMLKLLKQEQQKLHINQTKIKNIDQIIQYFQLRQKCSPQVDFYKLVLQLVLFGFDLNRSLSASDCQKLCKKYLIKPAFQVNEGGLDIKTGLIQYSQLLRKIVYGQSNHTKRELSQLIELKSKIKKKGLLQIIAELKEENAADEQKNLKFQKQRKSFVQKFQKETEQLAKSWDQLKRQKQKYQLQKQRKQKEYKEVYYKKQQEMVKKYRILQQQQKQKINQLKKKRQNIQNQIQRQKNSLIQVEQKLSRKFVELQEFQNHFNEFIEQKQHIKSLQIQINQITMSLNKQKQKYQNLSTKVRQLTLQQGIYQNRIYKFEEQLKQKNKQIHQLQRYRNQLHKLTQINKEQLYRQNEKLRDIVNLINNKSEQIKDYEKIAERSKKNYNLMQQKLKNIEQMQTNKRLAIRQLEQQIRCLKQDKQDLISKVENLQKNTESKRQQLLKIQLKIQENRFAMQQLTDINKSVSDMMIRQSQLKRSIIELQIQNKNLTDMKNNLLDDFKIKQYV